MENIYDLPVWKYPGDYGGHNPEGHYILGIVTRDCDIRAQSNYHSTLNDLLDAADGDSEAVYEFRASHWGFGWQDHIIVKNTAPEAVQKRAYEILGVLEQYPVLNDDDFYTRQREAIDAHWFWLRTQDRIDLCAQAGVSIFAARRDKPPREVSEYLEELDQFN